MEGTERSDLLGCTVGREPPAMSMHRWDGTDGRDQQVHVFAQHPMDECCSSRQHTPLLCCGRKLAPSLRE